MHSQIPLLASCRCSRTICRYPSPAKWRGIDVTGSASAGHIGWSWFRPEGLSPAVRLRTGCSFSVAAPTGRRSTRQRADRRYLRRLRRAVSDWCWIWLAAPAGASGVTAPPRRCGTRPNAGASDAGPVNRLDGGRRWGDPAPGRLGQRVVVLVEQPPLVLTAGLALPGLHDQPAGVDELVARLHWPGADRATVLLTHPCDGRSYVDGLRTHSHSQEGAGCWVGCSFGRRCPCRSGHGGEEFGG